MEHLSFSKCRNARYKRLDKLSGSGAAKEKIIEVSSFTKISIIESQVSNHPSMSNLRLTFFLREWDYWQVWLLSLELNQRYKRNFPPYGRVIYSRERVFWEIEMAYKLKDEKNFRSRKRNPSFFAAQDANEEICLFHLRSFFKVWDWSPIINE